MGWGWGEALDAGMGVMVKVVSDSLLSLLRWDTVSRLPAFWLKKVGSQVMAALLGECLHVLIVIVKKMMGTLIVRDVEVFS